MGGRGVAFRKGDGATQVEGSHGGLSTVQYITRRTNFILEERVPFSSHSVISFGDGVHPDPLPGSSRRLLRERGNKDRTTSISLPMTPSEEGGLKLKVPRVEEEEQLGER
jgi:hypothetical protein